MRAQAYQLFGKAPARNGSWLDWPGLPWLASALACAVIIIGCSFSGGTREPPSRAPSRTTRPATINPPSSVPEGRIEPVPEIGSAQPHLAMRAVTDPQRKLLYVNLWGEVGAHDGERFRKLVTPYVRSGYLVYRVTISSLGGSVEAAVQIGEQIRQLRSQVRAPFRDKQGQAHCVFKQASQDKVHREGDGLADPDGFACRCASACSFIWASGFLRDGDVIGVHMFTFVDDAVLQWSSRELRRRTEGGVRELDGFLARMGMPAPLRAHVWTTPPNSIYELTPSEIATMTRNTPFAQTRQANCKAGNDPLPRWEPLPASNDPERSPCDQRTLMTMMRLSAARYLGRLDS